MNALSDRAQIYPRFHTCISLDILVIKRGKRKMKEKEREKERENS